MIIIIRVVFDMLKRVVKLNVKSGMKIGCRNVLMVSVGFGCCRKFKLRLVLM